MSSAGVFLFDDMVLKIQEYGYESENEATMIAFVINIFFYFLWQIH